LTCGLVHQVPVPGQVSVFPPAFHTYSQAVRLLNDITARHAAVIAENCGGDPARILEAGYGVVTPAFLRVFKSGPESIRPGAIVLPCRNAQGEIVALHDHRFQWFTQPQVHIANAVRAPWSQIEVCETTSQADSLALSANVCAVGCNYCDQRTVAAAVLSALRSHSSHTIKRGEKFHALGVAA